MVKLLGIPIPEKYLAIYDPACGTGGMLSVAKEHLLDRAKPRRKRNGSKSW
jgi:type I restriction enzyme M protein